jgi:hypothetical protein
VSRYGPLLLMLGLLLGPVYYLFCEYSSGQPGDTFTLSERAARWTLPDGTILRFVRGQAYRPLTFKLDPQMNRIAFRLTFQAAAAEAGASQGSDEYRVTLMQADQPIFQRAFVVKLSPGANTTVDAGRLELYYPGAYEFVLEEGGTPRIAVSQVTVQVRQNIETLFLPLVWGGIAMLVAGVALVLEPYLPGRRAGGRL